MGLYINDNGNLLPIAGRGKAEYGASTVRTGTIKNLTLPANGELRVDVTFDTPMPDANYIVVAYQDGNDSGYVSYINKTANGFSCYLRGTLNASSVCYLTYTAFKLYTDTEYNGLLNNQRYSTDEINTGKTWIDGKPIYRNIFIFTTPLAVSSTSWTDTGISGSTYNVDTLTDARAGRNDGYTSSDNVVWAMNCSCESSSTFKLLAPRDNGQMSVKWVYVEYTKTTD